jgi:hypothetical protein
MIKLKNKNKKEHKKNQSQSMLTFNTLDHHGAEINCIKDKSKKIIKQNSQ